MSTDPEPHHTSLSASLQAILAGESEKVTLEEIVNAIDDKQFGMLLILLSIPSALPIPAPGYSTPFGIAILILGAQMLLGRRTPWFPAKMRRKEFTRAKLSGMLSKAGKFFQKLEKCVKPRLGWI
ncbi:MAG: exopolysaccharide biosynthesis protein, partial [Verrucomicrobiota bacterium]